MNSDMIIFPEQSTAFIPENSTDELIIGMWFHGKSARTQEAYRTDVDALLGFTRKTIQQLTLYDLQQFSDSLQVKDSSKARTLAAIKSLLTFAYKSGYTPLNVGAALKLPKLKSGLANRILTEQQAISLIVKTDKPRDHALLRLMYHCGLRVSEVCNLEWNDLVERSNGRGQLNVFGKGDKLRHILVEPDMWNELMSIRPENYQPHDPVFPSRKGHGKLDESQIHRIVRDAAKRAGIKGNISPHWLRHAHASHSLDRGAPISLVSETLGHASLATTGKYTHARPNASSSQYLPL